MVVLVRAARGARASCRHDLGYASRYCRCPAASCRDHERVDHTDLHRSRCATRAGRYSVEA
jgi:CHAD domain-containing protein